MNNTVECVLDAKAELGEGLCWDSRSNLLYWVDINRYELHIYYPSTRTDLVIHTGEYVNTVAPRYSGGLVVGLQHAISCLDIKTGKFSKLAELESDLLGNRINDGKCGPDGRFWVGTTGLDFSQGKGGFYVMDANHSIRTLLSGCSISNGLCWSADNQTLFWIDSLTRKVDAFDYDMKEGVIGNRRQVLDFGEEAGLPDGMTIDEEDKLWIASFGGGCVGRWDPETGELITKIALPCSNVTNCTFGGEALDTLYITTARLMLSQEQLAEQPQAGGLFAVDPGVRGTAAYEFAG